MKIVKALFHPIIKKDAVLFVPTDIKSGSGLMAPLLPSTLSSMANLSRCMKDGESEDGGPCEDSEVKCLTEPLWFQS